MTITKKLYEIDSHLRAFSARVLSCESLAANGFAVILDQTAFFPEGGGQAADTGHIGETFVFDTSLQDGVIIHFCDRPLECGNEYSCEIDWDKRFPRMQNHSGEHIVSGLIHRHFGFDNVGFHMGHEDVTLDINGILSDSDIRMIEELANKAVWENVNIYCEYPAPEALAAIDYRSKLELTENVRLVTIEGYDVCACCAPHVNRTGEIGIIKLLDHEKNKGGTRIHMLCGMDALKDYNYRYYMISKASRALSVKQSSLGEAIKRMDSEISELKNKNYLLRAELSERKIAELEATSGNICIFEEGITQGDMRRLMNAALLKCGGISAVFCRKDENEYTFTAAGKNTDMKIIASEMRTRLNAKGGGSSEMIQGSVCASEREIKEFFEV